MGETVHPSQFGLGDIAIEDTVYDAHMLTYDALCMQSDIRWEMAAIPEFDGRAHGWVTPAKSQGVCGSCWAHAAVGTIESRILKDNWPQCDISEQQQISCNTSMQGCCGGSGQALLFYYTNKPWPLGSAPYAESGTKCPVQRTKTCSDFSCEGLPYLASGFYTVERTGEAIKKSILEHGPSYFRYDVYEDFYDHWMQDTPGIVYKQSAGKRLGGHAVLIVGWSDAKNAWLIKNSWGPNQGPDKDGCFWMAYEGHANDLKFQMFNITGLNKTA